MVKSAGPVRLLLLCPLQKTLNQVGVQTKGSNQKSKSQYAIRDSQFSLAIQRTMTKSSSKPLLTAWVNIGHSQPLPALQEVEDKRHRR